MQVLHTAGSNESERTFPVQVGGQDLRMNSTFRTGLRDFHWISLKLAEMRYLLYIFYVITNQLLMYTGSLGDVQPSLNAAMASVKYVEPVPDPSFIASCLRSTIGLCSFILFN